MREDPAEVVHLERPGAGTPPRKRAGFILVLAILAGVIVAALALFRMQGTFDRQADSSVPPLADEESSRKAQDSGAANSNSIADPLQDSTRTPPKPEQPSGPMPPLPELPLPAEPTEAGLELLRLPALPYAIFQGAYRTLQEAETVRRDLLGRSIPSYIVPVEVQGTVAQALYGVASDGIWYRILIGHFGTSSDARQFLARFMEWRPNDQPEIMKFSYTLECGRFLDDPHAESLIESLLEDGFLPYVQEFPTQGGSRFSRVLVGATFSSQGAQKQKQALADRGYACSVVER